MHGPETPALAMGDFNDEPSDTSLVIHALSERQRQKVVDADNPGPLEPDLVGHGGTAPTAASNDNKPNLLDQFLVNKSMCKPDSPIRAKPESVEILRFPGTFTGKYKRPRPFGGMGKPVDEDGFSDHFPIGMHVTEAD